MNILTFFLPNAPWVMVYMLQQFEYDNIRFMTWLETVPNIMRVQQRGKLDLTSRAKITLFVTYIAWVIPLFGGLLWALLAHAPGLIFFSTFAPLIAALALLVFNWIFWKIVVEPSNNKEIAASVAKLADAKAVRIAVLGSYGKTSMKEILLTVLSNGRRVAATPGNKNVPISHARWIQKLSGDEEVLIFEYGEGEPGDIKRLAKVSQPSYAVVTGLAPAHLDKYPSVEAIADDFAKIQQHVTADKLYVKSSLLLKEKVKGIFYSNDGVGEWQVKDAVVSFEGTRFTLGNGQKELKFHSQLLGLHQIGPLAAACVLAMQLGLSDEQIIAGISQTTPFEHRMQPRALHGAWIIDDTYNGNIEGMRAGLDLLKILPAKRRIYVTPGLVDQGEETQKVHEELGHLIAAAAPDKVVLMENSATTHIVTGLEAGGYQGELERQNKPLEFYTNLEHYLAAGDVVMLQNDWPDSYS